MRKIIGWLLFSSGVLYLLIALITIAPKTFSFAGATVLALEFAGFSIHLISGVAIIIGWRLFHKRS